MSTSSKWLPLSLIGLGIVLFVLSLAIPYFPKTGSDTTAAPVPTQVGDYTLASKATGSAALREFTQLHGKSLPVNSGSKAVYGTESQVIIWIAGTASSNDSRVLLEAMRDRIAEGKSPFQPSGFQTIGNREVYALDGMGQKHFYFQSGKYLVWMASNAEVADRVLQQVLNFYP